MPTLPSLRVRVKLEVRLILRFVGGVGLATITLLSQITDMVNVISRV